MTVAELLHEAYTLNPQERKTLAKLLIDSLDVPTRPDFAEIPDEHWGKSLNQLMEEIGTIEMRYPDIEDPVVWAKYHRAEQRRQRFGQSDAGESLQN